MKAIDQLKNKYNLEYSGELIKVVPLGRYRWKTSPINVEDSFILLSENDFVCLATRLAQINQNLNGIEPFNNADFKEYLRNKISQQE